MHKVYSGFTDIDPNLAQMIASNESYKRDSSYYAETSHRLYGSENLFEALCDPGEFLESKEEYRKNLNKLETIEKQMEKETENIDSALRMFLGAK
jgi:hypothetical protein